MQELAKFLYSFSKNKKISDEYFIGSIGRMLIDNYNLNDYVERIIISNFNKNSLAYYSPEERNIYVNFQKLLYAIGKTIIKTYESDNYEEQILCFNLYVLNVILHEVEHARQIRIIDSDNSVETNLLLLSRVYERFLKNVSAYTEIAYCTNPIERQANLLALKTLFDITETFNNQNLTKFIGKNLLRNTIRNYKIYKNKVISPIDVYMSYCDRYIDATSLRNINDKCTRIIQNSEKQFELGLVTPLNVVREKIKQLTLY